MIDAASLPANVLVRIAVLEQNCTGLATRLEAARRELQRLRAERINTVPNAVHDEASALIESDRVLGEWARIDDAIETQTTRCEALERRLRGAEGVVRSCKQFLHELPANARLVEHNVDNVHALDDVDDIRSRLDAVKGEIARTTRTPTLSGDLGSRIADYVADLASKARPVISGTGDGETLRVSWPLNDHADRTTQSGFSPHECNALLMFALLDGKRLAERLLQVATEVGISSNEREMRLRSLRSAAMRTRQPWK